MKYGEIVQLGRHRLMCGDATKAEDVEKLIDGRSVDLVLTDPPYGVNSVDKNTGKIGGGGKRYMPVIGDTCTDIAEEHYRIARTLTNRQIIWGGQNFTRFLPPSCGWIFWDKLKPTDKLSFGDGELAWCNFGTKIKKYAFKWNGNHRDGDPRVNDKVHPNQKPVELHAHILEDFSQEGDVILDCFGGSGTTLIACEITNRTCLMMEVSPEYCDVIKNRYDKLMEGRLGFGSATEDEG